MKRSDKYDKANLTGIVKQYQGFLRDLILSRASPIYYALVGTHTISCWQHMDQLSLSLLPTHSPVGLSLGKPAAAIHPPPFSFHSSSSHNNNDGAYLWRRERNY